MSNTSFNQKGVSLYYQVETYIRTKIESGEWPSGFKLPTETELCQYFGVSRTTIRQAVNKMVEGGLLMRKQGSGTYVTQPAYSRNRLSTQPSDSVCKYIYMPILQDDMEHSYQNLLLTHISHILMLCEQKLISQEDGKNALDFIVPLMDMHPQTIGFNPLNEDYFLNFEQYLISHLGIDLAGKIYTGRSRNDMTPTVMRMSIRDSMLAVYERLLALIRRLLALAEENQGRIITGYTHCMPAQPITLDHYFLAIAEALVRDMDRLLSAYQNLNRSPLGACAMAGTSFPINREYTAQLLGFDGIITNTLDAVATRDYLLELAADFSTLGSTLSRFAQDLYLWSTAEFNYVSFSDAYSCCSSIMPQKKNPLSIEHIKSKSSHLTSTYLDIAMCLKGTSYGHCRDLFECMPPFWDAVEQVTGMLELSIGTLQDITFHYDRMEFTASMNDSILTDMADFLVQKDRIPFRSAHNIIASAVRAQGDNPSSKITLKQLNKSSKQHLGHDTTLTESEWASLQSPRSSVANKRSEGSPAQSSCRKMLLSLRMAVDRCNEQYNKIINSLQLAEQFRKEQIDVLKNGTHFEHN